MRKVKERPPKIIAIADVISVLGLLLLALFVYVCIHTGIFKFGESPYKNIDKKYLPHINSLVGREYKPYDQDSLNRAASSSEKKLKTE